MRVLGYSESDFMRQNTGTQFQFPAHSPDTICLGEIVLSALQVVAKNGLLAGRRSKAAAGAVGRKECVSVLLKRGFKVRLGARLSLSQCGCTSDVLVQLFPCCRSRSCYDTKAVLSHLSGQHDKRIKGRKHFKHR